LTISWRARLEVWMRARPPEAARDQQGWDEDGMAMGDSVGRQEIGEGKCPTACRV
jgi:hypothetical protein